MNRPARHWVQRRPVRRALKSAVRRAVRDFTSATASKGTHCAVPCQLNSRMVRIFQLGVSFTPNSGCLLCQSLVLAAYQQSADALQANRDTPS